MNFIQIAIAFIFLLFAANILTGGEVWNGLSSQNSSIPKLAACGLGTYFLTPYTVFFGMRVSLPDAADILLVAMLTILLYYILRNSLSLQFYHAVLIFLTLFCLLKIIAFALVAYAGNECYSFMETANGFSFLPLTLLTFCFGIPMLVAFFLSVKRHFA